ncbi:MAG: tetratricopeptide repeat protein [Jejuia sp.]
MDISKKSYVLLSVFCFLFLLNCGSDLSERIPELPDLSSSSNAQKVQIGNAHQKAIKNASSKNLGELGKVYYASNFYDRAKSCFQLARMDDSDSWEWSYYKGLIHMELGESDSALHEMKMVKTVNPDVWLASYRLANVYRQMDSVEKAETALKEIINLNTGATKITNSLRSTYFPLQLYARLLLSQVYTSANENNKAKKELNYLTKRYKTFGAPFKQLGILYATEGNTKLSKKYGERAGDLPEVNEPLDTLQDKLALISTSENYVLKQIDIARAGVDSKWSSELIKAALENMPESKYVLSKAISQYLSQGTGELALPFLNKHFDSFKDVYNETFKTGVELADAGYRTDALRYFRHAITFDDITDEQRANIAGVYFEKLGISNKAIELMDEVVTSNRTNPKILGDAMFLMLQTNQLEKAQSYYKDLKRVDAAHPSVKIYEGTQLEKRGNISSATKLYLSALERDPKNKYIIQHVKDLMLKQERWTEMKGFLRNALEVYPNDSQLQMYLGWVLVSYPDENNKINDITEGLEYSERAFYNCRYQVGDRVSAGRTLALGYYLLKDNTMADYYINRTIGIAIKAKFGQDYIQGLQSLKRRISSGR